MKLKNLITAGAVSLAALLGTPAKAHDTIRIPGEKAFELKAEKEQ